MEFYGKDYFPSAVFCWVQIIFVQETAAEKSN